jgi:hypothetical protein
MSAQAFLIRVLSSCSVVSSGGRRHCHSQNPIKLSPSVSDQTDGTSPHHCRSTLFTVVSSAGFPGKLQQKSYRFTLSVGFSCCGICNRYGPNLQYRRMYLCLAGRMHSWLQSSAILKLVYLICHVCISKQHFKRALSNEVPKSEIKTFTDTLYIG